MVSAAHKYLFPSPSINCSVSWDKQVTIGHFAKTLLLLFLVSDLVSPSRQLVWDSEYDQVFQAVKAVLCN